MNLFNELIGIIDELNAGTIDYAVCGGLAVAFHGFVRFTKDIDIMILAEDIEKVYQAVHKQGFTIKAGPILFGVHTPGKREIYRISKIEDDEVLTLDLLIVNPLLEKIWEERELFEIEGHTLYVVSREGLIEMKKIAGRDQDAVDIKKLQGEIDG